MTTAKKVLAICAILTAVILAVVLVLFLVNEILRVTDAGGPARRAGKNITPEKWESALGFHERVKKDWQEGRLQEHEWYRK
jgi:hypothetical protein